MPVGAYAGTVLEDADDPTKPRYLTFSATSTGFHKQEDAGSLRLFTPDPAHGCADYAAPDARHVAVVLRGGEGCTFAEKVERAQSSGSFAVIVVNNVPSMYNATTDRLLNPCAVDCSSGGFEDEASCRAGSACGVCAETPKRNDLSSKWCCVPDRLLDMSLGQLESKATIPAVFASIQDGNAYILEAAAARREVRLYRRELAEVDGSVFIIATLGVLVMACSSYRAGSKERTWLRKKRLGASESVEAAPARARAASGHRDDSLERVTLTMKAAMFFLVWACISLIVLFFLVQYFPTQIVIALQVIFVLGSSGTFSYVYAQPVLRLLLGSERSGRMLLPHTAFAISLQDALGYAVGAVLGWTWFAERHQPFAWLLLDLLASSMVCSFLLVVRLPNLRVATGLLALFFVYDVFMVFITPMIFGGRSVMVDVATAGKASEQIAGETCERRRDETLPMLLTVPRLEWTGGYALLGLGDLILPGLLVVLGVRIDYLRAIKTESLMRRETAVAVASHSSQEELVASDAEAGSEGPRRRRSGGREGALLLTTPSSACDSRARKTYRETLETWLRDHVLFLLLVLAYIAGLVLTFTANIRGWSINGVQGQPALLYLVPTTLATFYAVTYWRGETRLAWSGAWNVEEEEEEVAEGEIAVDRDAESRASRPTA